VTALSIWNFGKKLGVPDASLRLGKWLGKFSSFEAKAANCLECKNQLDESFVALKPENPKNLQILDYCFIFK
jgi:hypothetical protein